MGYERCGSTGAREGPVRGLYREFDLPSLLVMIDVVSVETLSINIK
jgi:hypothetical protein